MDAAAYLVGYIELRHGKLEYVGADIFSEPEPSQAGGEFKLQAVLLKGYGETFADGVEDLLSRLRQLAEHMPAYAALLKQLCRTSRASHCWKI